MSKKIISIVLALVMVLAMSTVALVSVSADLSDLPEKAEGTKRYFFYMPPQWQNEYAYTAGIYWWEGTDACSAWPGYVANETGVEGVYYYDVNVDVTTIIWNNAIDGGTDDTQAIYTAAYQTKNIGSEYYDVDESVNYPEGTDNFDEMIYVVDESKTEVNDYSGKSTFAGEWFYYYGNGEYGFTPEKGDVYFNQRSYNEAPTPVTGDTTETEAATDAPVVEETGVKVTVDGVEYTAQVGDVITYTTNLTTPKAIENIQAFTSYDSATLKLVSDASTMFPNMLGVVANPQDGVIYYNASEITKGFDFTAGQALITLEFEVIGEADATIDTTIEEMVEFFGGDYVTGGEIVADGVTVVETLVVPEPVVTTTAAPETEATTVVAPTEDKTDATSATEKPADKPADVPATGATVAIYVTLAVLAMAAAAVVVLRKKVNG